MAKQPPADQYSKAEAERRFLDALRGGLSTPAKPLKDKPKARKKVKKKPPK